MKPAVIFIFLCVCLFYSPEVQSRTVEQVVKRMGPAAVKRLKPHFQKAGVDYPPSKIALIGLKEEKTLELWAKSPKGWVWIKDYPMLAASGVAGPKLRQGDLQVPEGIYRIIVLNPNSRFHLSMKVDYPNASDRSHAKKEGRKNLGGDIFIHGDAVSIGCIAIGDPGIEELFVTVAKIGRGNVKVIISPNDLRSRKAPKKLRYERAWISKLHEKIEGELKGFARN